MKKIQVIRPNVHEMLLQKRPLPLIYYRFANVIDESEKSLELAYMHLSKNENLIPEKSLYAIAFLRNLENTRGLNFLFYSGDENLNVFPKYSGRLITTYPEWATFEPKVKDLPLVLKGHKFMDENLEIWDYKKCPTIETILNAEDKYRQETLNLDEYIAYGSRPSLPEGMITER